MEKVQVASYIIEVFTDEDLDLDKMKEEILEVKEYILGNSITEDLDKNDLTLELHLTHYGHKKYENEEYDDAMYLFWKLIENVIPEKYLKKAKFKSDFYKYIKFENNRQWIYYPETNDTSKKGKFVIWIPVFENRVG